MTNRATPGIRIFLHLQQGLPTAMKTQFARPGHPALHGLTLGLWSCRGTAIAAHNCSHFSAKVGPRRLVETISRIDQIALQAYHQIVLAWASIHLTYELFNDKSLRIDASITPPAGFNELPEIFDDVWRACEFLEQATLARIPRYSDPAEALYPPE